MSYRKKLIVLVCSVFIYLVIVFLYNSINNSEFKEVLVLKRDVLRGELLKEEDFERIYVKEKNIFFGEELILSNVTENFIFEKDLSKGTLLLKEYFVEKSQYVKAANESEIISIKISNPEDIVSYQIEKNSIVNIYYTGKLELAKGVLKDINLPYITNKTESINRADNEYITIKLAENIKVIDVFDKHGNVVESGKYVKSDSNKIDTIMFEIKKDLVMKINNLKNYGQFSISMVR